jgi:hypothetical protein
MADRIDGAKLLRIARQTLERELAPHVPSERRYELLMVDNAMGIAARELTAGDGPARRAIERLERLYGLGNEEQPNEATGEPRAALERLNGRFAADIRSGRFDAGPERAAAAVHLRESALDAVRISNPRLLQRRGFE